MEQPFLLTATRLQFRRFLCVNIFLMCCRVWICENCHMHFSQQILYSRVRARMFDLGQLRKLAKAPHSGVEEVKTARVHLALEPGYLNNLDAGIKHNFNAKINQHFAE